MCVWAYFRLTETKAIYKDQFFIIIETEQSSWYWWTNHAVIIRKETKYMSNIQPTMIHLTNHTFLCLFTMIKFCICSYQFNIWYADYYVTRREVHIISLFGFSCVFHVLHYIIGQGSPPKQVQMFSNFQLLSLLQLISLYTIFFMYFEKSIILVIKQVLLLI